VLRTLACVVGVAGVAWAGEPYDAAAVYDEVCRLAEERFLDPEMNGVDWGAACADRRAVALRATSALELAPVVDDLLAELGTSHTAFYAKGSRQWAELIDIFFDDALWDAWPEDFVTLPVRHVSAGIVTREIGDRVFVADVYPGSAADVAGVMTGDELISVDRRRWTDRAAWPGGLDEAVEVRVRRRAQGPLIRMRIVAERVRPDEVFAEAQRRSVRVEERGGARVAVVRLRNGGGAYTELFEEQLRSDEIQGADALVLDIRGGWGGVPLDFLTRFDLDIATFEARMRGQAWSAAPTVWRKPLVLVIDGGSRSGKEILAYNARSAGRGVLVGERTLGAVVGGSPFPLPDGSILYLAVMDVLVDGERLEGVGVAPDVRVPFELPYSAGADPQLEAAIEEAARLVAG